MLRTRFSTGHSNRFLNLTGQVTITVAHNAHFLLLSWKSCHFSLVQIKPETRRNLKFYKGCTWWRRIGLSKFQWLTLVQRVFVYLVPLPDFNISNKRNQVVSRRIMSFKVALKFVWKCFSFSVLKFIYFHVWHPRGRLCRMRLTLRRKDRLWGPLGTWPS